MESKHLIITTKEDPCQNVGSILLLGIIGSLAFSASTVYTNKILYSISATEVH